MESRAGFFVVAQVLLRWEANRPHGCMRELENTRWALEPIVVNGWFMGPKSDYSPIKTHDFSAIYRGTMSLHL